MSNFYEILIKFVYLFWKLEVVSFTNYMMIFDVYCICNLITVKKIFIKFKKTILCTCIHSSIMFFSLWQKKGCFPTFPHFCSVWWSYYFLLFHFHLSSSVQASAISFYLLNGDGSLVIDVSVALYSYSCGKYLAYLNFSSWDTVCF